MSTAVILVILVLAGASMMIWGLGSILVPGFSSRRRGVILLLAGLVVVVNTSLYVRDNYWGASAERRQVLQAKDGAPGSFLRQPEAICRLLVDHGFTPERQEASGSIWGQVTPMYYSCQAIRAGSVDEIPTTLTYRVQSDDGNRVDLIRLQVEVTADYQDPAVLEEFKQVSRVLFERIPTPMPDGFVTAVDNRRFRQFDQEDGTVELLHDRYEQGYRLRMEIRPDSRKP